MSSLSDSPENIQQLEDQQDTVIKQLDELNGRIMAILDEFSPPKEESNAAANADLPEPTTEVEPLRRAA